MAMNSRMGLGKLIMRLVLLKPTGNTDESERALVGNTILVAQPSPEMVAAELPPTESEQASYFNVVYGAGASEHVSSKLGKKKALTVNRQEYMECAKIRAERCPLFADKTVSAVEAESRLPESGVPNGIVRGAVDMESLQDFVPSLSGPATNQTPFTADNDEDQADDVEDHLDEADLQHGDGDSGCCRAPDALIAEENANAEIRIGLDGSPDDGAIGKLAACRAKLQLAEEARKRIGAAAVRTREAACAGNETSKAMEPAADLAALLADHKSVLVDMRTIARSLGTDHVQREIEESVTSAHRKSSPATLRIHTGAPMSLFDPAAWVACLVEFFYGDCAPNLERPAKILWRQLFRYHMNREELDYHLESDVETCGRAYSANPDSRWNTPEFAALATDAVRKLSVLQSTKAFWENTATLSNRTCECSPRPPAKTSKTSS